MGNFDYEEIQKKLNPTEESNNADLADIEDDREFSMDAEKYDEDEELEVDEEEKEEKEEEEGVEEEEVKKEKVTPDESGLTQDQKRLVQENVIRVMGKDAILKIKGVERKVSDLTPDEFTIALQKGIRADQLFQEEAAKRKELVREKAALDQRAATVTQLMEQYGQKGPTGWKPGQGKITEIPKHLMPDPDDTPEIREYKLNEVRTLDRLNAMEQIITQAAEQDKAMGEIQEVKNIAQHYPMASIDECISILAARPDTDKEELVRASHNYYAGEAHIRDAIKHNPEFSRKYEQEVIKRYLAGKNQAPTIKGRVHKKSPIDRVSEKSKVSPKGRSFEDADSLSKQYLAEISRMEKEG